MDNPYAAPRAEVVDPPEGEGGGGPDDHAPAPHLRRAGAAVFDLGLSLAVLFGGLFGAVVLAGLTTDGDVMDVIAEWERALDAIPDSLFGLMLGVPLLLSHAAFEGSRWRGTPGKRLLGLEVVRADGAPLGFGGALKRNLFKWLLLNLCSILAFSVFNADRLGIWDRAAQTRVVRRRGSNREGIGARGSAPRAPLSPSPSSPTTPGGRDG